MRRCSRCRRNGSTPMSYPRRSMRLWWALLKLSFLRHPVMTSVALAAMTVGMVMPAAIALALRYVVDASAARDVRAAVAGGIGAGLVYGLSLVLVNLVG